jgi:AcrR family transcriptional regulator
MRQNPQRRTALLDAAIEVLAREGSRGLTLRAVDAEAGVPRGTASNYFANRPQLLGEVMRRVRERLAPDEAELAQTLRRPPSRELVVSLMHELMERVRRDRSSHLAMLEMRLEATRRPELQAELTRAFGEELEANVEFHIGVGLPGDETSVVVLYLAMLGMIVDDLTVPGVLSPYGADALVDEVVARILPARTTRSRRRPSA